MKAKLFDIVIILVAACFIAGAIAELLGVLSAPLTYALPVLGMILIGAAASGKRRRDR